MIRSKLNRYCLACLSTSEMNLLSVDDIIVSQKFYGAVVTYKCKRCDEVRQFDYKFGEPMSFEEIRKEHSKEVYGK